MRIIDFGLILPSKGIIPFGSEQVVVLEKYRESLDDLIINSMDIPNNDKRRLMAESMAVVRYLKEHKTWD